MSVYAGERADLCAECLRTIAADAPADQVVIVEDGPIPEELDQVLGTFEGQLPLVRVRLPGHAGLGRALAEGLKACRNEIVCRMDADDLVVPGRFAAQIRCLVSDRDLAIVGGQIEEFDSSTGVVVGTRSVPLSAAEIRRHALFRNPMNHMTVAFRREAIMGIGSYRHAPGVEDYDLWVRALAAGLRMENLPAVLVRARTTPEFYERRSGIRYVKAEWWMAKVKWTSGLWRPGAVLAVAAARMFSRVLPRPAIKRVYRALRS